jgi:hypothetical protein
MIYDLTSSKWFIPFIAIVLPMLLMIVVLALSINICWVLVMIVWMAMGLMVLYLPNRKD